MAAIVITGMEAPVYLIAAIVPGRKLEEEQPSYPVVEFSGPTAHPGVDTESGLYLLGRSASLKPRVRARWCCPVAPGIL
jgi:hypothetical protein